MSALLLALALLQGRAGARGAPPAPAYPWAVGEKLTYSAKLGMLTLGSGTLEVAGVDTVRGVESLPVPVPAAGQDHRCIRWTTCSSPGSAPRT